MYYVKLSGFTDEASSSLAGQIKVTQELGWNYLSARMIDGSNIHDLPEEYFDKVVEQLAEANIKVAEFGTMIGSWAKGIDSDWQLTIDEIERCIPRMKKLGVKYARVMSYAQLPWGEDQNEKERFRRLREIVKRFEDEGLQALHENCMNWGGFSAEHTLRLLEEVPGLKLVFDWSLITEPSLATMVSGKSFTLSSYIKTFSRLPVFVSTWFAYRTMS